MLGDYGINRRYLVAKMVVFPISEENRNKHGDAVEKRRNEKIEEFDNIQSMNRVRISNKSISKNETEFDKKPDDNDKANPYFRSSCNSSVSDFWFLLTLLYFVTIFQ